MLKDVQSHQDDANAIIQLATSGSFKGVTWDRLALLTDSIGHRLCGSESLQDAVEWSRQQLSAEGFDNVHLEQVSEPRWVRGMEYAELREPRKRPQPLAMLGLGSSIGTPREGITAEVIVVRNFTELAARAADVKGKIVVYNEYCNWRAQPIGCYGNSVTYRSSGAQRAAQYGAVASLTRSVTGFSMNTPHTGGSQRSTIPAAALATEDVDMLQRMQDRGQRMVIHMYMEAQTLNNTVGHNVVAEIKGSTYPDEVVLVSGHLDSWDVGVGAMDDGDGAILSWSALSLVKKAGLKPKRTLRLLFWSCEEQGGIGGHQYYQDHVGELKNMDAVFEADLGVFTPYGLELTANNATTTIVREIGQLLTAINASQVVGGGEGTDIQVSITHTHSASGIRASLPSPLCTQRGASSHSLLVSLPLLFLSGVTLCV